MTGRMHVRQTILHQIIVVIILLYRCAVSIFDRAARSLWQLRAGGTARHCPTQRGSLPSRPTSIALIFAEASPTVISLQTAANLVVW